MQIRTAYNICYQLQLESEGFAIYLRRTTPKQFEQHIYNALEVAYTQYQNKYIRQIKLSNKDLKDIRTATYSTIYNTGNDYYSLTSDVTTQIKNIIEGYLMELNSAFHKTSELPPPSPVEINMEEEDWLFDFEGETILSFLYSEFIFDAASTSAMMERNAANNSQECLENLWTRYLKSKPPDIELNADTPYPRSELINYFNDTNLRSGEKYGHLIKPKRGYYQLAFLKAPPPWVIEEPEQNNEEGENE